MDKVCYYIVEERNGLKKKTKKVKEESTVVIKFNTLRLRSLQNK